MASNLGDNLKPTVSLKNFRFWCQKVLPLVYDDSISYYEVLGKMVVYLNQVIDDVNADIDNVNTLKDAFIELQEYVAEAIQYDIHDLEVAVASAIHSAEMASESATLASGSAETATGAESNALEYAQQASGSAGNAAQSAIHALEAQEQASGYAGNANTSARNAADSALNAIRMADQASGYCERAETAAENAETDAGSAEHFKNEANDSALIAEGYSVGTQHGVDVQEGSPYWHNNAEYYADQAGTASGVHPTITGLEDTNITNPTNGQALVYDSASEMWINSDEATGVTSLDALTDTDIETPTAGQVLMYDVTNEKWVNSEEKEVAIAPSAPSNPSTKIWIQSTEQTGIEIPTVAELNAAFDELVNDIDEINSSLQDKADSTSVIAGLATKENKATVITQSNPNAIALADNNEYYLTNVSTLEFTYPESGNFECWIYLETATSGAINITLPTSGYIGDEPEFAINEKWEISIKNGVVIAGAIA